MKKILIALTAAMLVLTLCACGEDSSSDSKSSASEAPAVSTDAEESKTEESKAEESKAEQSESGEKTGLSTALEKVKEQVQFPGTTNDFTLKRIKRTFGIEESQIEDFAGMYCADGVQQDQVLYITAKTDEDVSFIEQKFNENLESIYNVIKNYTPEQVAIIEAAKVEVNGRTVSYVISSDAEKIIAIFNGQA